MTSPRPWRTALALALVLAAAAALRLAGLNWDGGYLFHPDERAIVMKAGELALPWPPDLKALLDPAASPLNPRWFAYGSFPLYLLKATAAAAAHWQPSLAGYPDMRLVGRVLATLFDVGTVLLTFLVAARLYRPAVGLLAAAFMAFSVLHIQLSHFSTVDVMLACLVMLTLYGAARTLGGLSLGASALMGVGLGLGLATKVSIAPLALAVGTAHLLALYRPPALPARRAGQSGAITPEPKPPTAAAAVAHLACSFALAAVVFVLAEPFALLDSTTFLRDVREQNEMVLRIRDYPYTRQYVDTPAYLYPLQQLIVWGLGAPLGLACAAGALAAVRRMLTGRHPADVLLLVWVLPYFAITGAFPVKFLRYLAPITPVLAILAARLLLDWRARRAGTGTGPHPALPSGGLSLSQLWERGGRRPRQGEQSLPNGPATGLRPPSPPPPGLGEGQTSRREGRVRACVPAAQPLTLMRMAGRGLLPTLTIALVLAATAWYAVAYLNVYRAPHPAVAASAWLRENLPPGAVVLQEHWEEGLPEMAGFTRRELRPYEPDDFAKLQHLSSELAGAGAVAFYSNRLYGTIPRLPERYPLTSRYYRLLFSGELGYELAFVATASPSLFGVTLTDDTFARPGLPSPGPAATPRPTPVTLNLGYADESFTVYDHPKVMVFLKRRTLTSSQIAALLTPPSGILPAPGLAAAPKTGLLLNGSDRAVQQQGGTWRALFAPASFANRSPALVWYLAVQLLGLIALPFTLRLFRGLPDGGYAFAKLLGLLGAAYLAWLAAALKLAPFAQTTILAGVGVMAAAALWLGWRRRSELRQWLAERDRVIMAEEALFGVAFLAFVLVRMLNPDLWHPYRGGEKPMDFAYLVAIAKSTTMPPYDPWFAGGYLNYYYYGQVIVATLIKLTGIAPETAYNLAVALFYAFTATGAFSVAYNLTESARRALAARGRVTSPAGPVLAGLGGAAGTALLGNLDGPAQIIEGLGRAAGTALASPFPVVGGALTAALGLVQVITGQAALPAFDFWRSSRMMPPTISITEFPFFTFLFADLHAHLLALPITLLALALAVNHTLGSRGRGAAGEAASLLALAWTAGTLRWTNSWDFPTYLLYAAGALLAAEAGRSGRLRLPEAIIAAVKLGALYGASTLLFLPFARSYELFYVGVIPSPETATAGQYLLINGIFLAPLVVLTLVEGLAVWPGVGALRWLRLSAGFWYEGGRLRRLQRRFALTLPEHLPAGKASRGSGAVGLGLLTLAGLAALALALSGYALAGALLAALAPLLLLMARELRRPAPGGLELTLALGMAALALAVAAGVEIVTLKGDIQRMNTVFKFYLQTWVLLALPAAFGAWYLASGAWRRERHGVPPASAQRLGRIARPCARPLMLAGALLVAGGLIYPLAATPVRLRDRFQALPPTLDGLAYMQSAVYQDERGPLTLVWDADAIRWLREQVDGSPPIAEGMTPLYRWGGRVSINTGLPTILGWDWHQRQQRWGYQQMVDERMADVRRLYSDPAPAAALDVLRKYGVQYLYVGELERRYYPPEGIAKFERMAGAGLEAVYRNAQVTVYRVTAGG